LLLRNSSIYLKGILSLNDDHDDPNDKSNQYCRFFFEV
jgi:hypothetical protein